MPNIATVLREEILRLARKEMRVTVGPLKKRVAELTRTNASLKRRVPKLEKTVARLQKEAEARQLQGVQAGAKDVQGVRIGPRSIQATRTRLKLSRDDFGKLAGVSGNSIYLWETGRVNPTEKSRAIIVGLRKLKTRDARKLLETMKAAEKPKPTKARKAKSKRKPRKKGKKR